jgi:hypothetical protein
MPSGSERIDRNADGTELARMLVTAMRVPGQHLVTYLNGANRAFTFADGIEAV